ncbi:MAG: cache domain-containing protein [Candidatus Kapaibacteriota bacterium]
MRILIAAVTLTLAVIAGACSSSSSPESAEVRIERGLREFVDVLELNPAVADTALSTMVRIYLLEHDGAFFGSTVCVLDTTGKAVYSPYWYRSAAGGVLYKDLASETTYDINEQAWLTEPIRTGAAVWSEPYFDEGGGEIWMKTLSMPVYVNGSLVAVATTDLALDQ